jgi:hypothetical protein
MSEPVTFSPALLQGFVEHCLQRGLTADQTEDAFRKAAANSLLSRPAVQAGLRVGLAKRAGAASTRCLSRALSPEILTQIVEHRLRYGDDPLSILTRKQAGWSEPDAEPLAEPLVKAAAQLSSTVQGFDRLPLNQQILLASLLGGGAGAAYRAFRPTNEDQAEGRGVTSRIARGAGRGAAVGAGVGAGTGAGGFASDALAMGRGKLPMMLMGGAGGGLAANRLMETL